MPSSSARSPGRLRHKATSICSGRGRPRAHDPVRLRRSARRARALARGVILAATVLAGARLVTSGSAASSLNLSNFVMTFDERFERLDISATGPGTRWIAHTPWNGDFGDARFDNPGPDGPFAKMSSGLSITARKTPRVIGIPA